MKIRNGFVSNSSSCSFIIPKEILSAVQIDMIKNHIEYAKENFPQLNADCCNAWDIEENEEAITACTSMNNFSMYKYLLLIGVKEEHLAGCFYR